MPTNERSPDTVHEEVETEQTEASMPSPAASDESTSTGGQDATATPEEGLVSERTRVVTRDADVTSDDRLIALLCYVSQLIVPFILPVIVLLSESNKKRPFQRYHAVQSLGLALALTFIAVALTLGTMVVQIVPLVGQLIGLGVLCLSPFAGLAVIGLAVYYGYQAYQGKYVKIPALTAFMQDQGWL